MLWFHEMLLQVEMYGTRRRKKWRDRFMYAAVVEEGGRRTTNKKEGLATGSKDIDFDVDVKEEGNNP